MTGKADHLREDRVSAIRRVMVVALHLPMLALLSWFTLSAAQHRDPETPFLVAMAASPAIGLGVALAGWYRRSADWIVLLDGVLAGLVALFAFGLFVISPPALVGDPIRGLGVALFLASLLAAGAGASQIDGRTGIPRPDVVRVIAVALLPAALLAALVLLGGLVDWTASCRPYCA